MDGFNSFDTEYKGIDTSNTPAPDYSPNNIPEPIKRRSTWVRGKNKLIAMREALGQGLEIAGITAFNAERIAQKTQYRQDAVEDQFDAVQRTATETADWGGEIIVASDGEPTLQKRLDRDKQQIEDVKKAVEDTGFNIRWHALMALDGDWTTAIQYALDAHTHIYIPKGTFKTTETLTVSKFGATISGAGQTYSDSSVEYNGSGTAIKVLPSVNYLKIQNFHLKGITSVSTDFFNSGTIGVDISGGATVVARDSWFEGFDSLFKSSYDSFYNKIIDCRLEKARYCLDGFNINNFEVKGNRFENFHVALRVNGTNGPLTIDRNSFEKFNSYIVLVVGAEKGLVVFENNYVEIFDVNNLPTNFPDMVTNGAKAVKFGGNILFGGTFGTLIIRGNDLQIGGVFRILSASACDYFESKGNSIHIYEVGNNLDRMFYSPSFKSYEINDRLGVFVGDDGGYSRAYNVFPLSVTNVYNTSYYFDCIVNKEIMDGKKIYSPTLQNGWINSGVAGYGGVKIFVTKEGLHLQGTIDGTAQTDVVVFTLPTELRPLVQGTTKAFANLVAFSELGAGNQIRFRYLYSSGTFRMEGSPSSKVNITLDGLIIPIQI